MLRPTAILPCLLSLTSVTPSLAAEDEAPTIEIDTSGRPYGFGVGVVAGEPTGLSFAARPDSDHAVQAHASWSFYRDWLRFNVDYLPSWVKFETGGAIIPIYAGIGGAVGVADNTAWLGARLPIGTAIHPKDVPLEPFLEIAPVVYVVPETQVGVDGAIGLRYYF